MWEKFPKEAVKAVIHEPDGDHYDGRVIDCNNFGRDIESNLKDLYDQHDTIYECYDDFNNGVEVHLHCYDANDKLVKKYEIVLSAEASIDLYVNVTKESQ